MEDIRTYLTVREVAQRLDISEEWVRNLIKNREIRAVKLAKWRVNPSDLEDFIEKRYNR